MTCIVGVRNKLGCAIAAESMSCSPGKLYPPGVSSMATKLIQPSPDTAISSAYTP